MFTLANSLAYLSVIQGSVFTIYSELLRIFVREYLNKIISKIGNIKGKTDEMVIIYSQVIY